MPGLVDLQKRLRDALVLGGSSGLESALVGGGDPSRRLAIHQRHYDGTLVSALHERFPATVWLLGSAFVTDAARAFVRCRPPSRPCIAEYGEEFPAFLATRPGAIEIPYLNQFTELEWHLGRLALAIDVQALTMENLSALTDVSLGDATITLQPGVHYLHADSSIDELISLYLSDRSPDHFILQTGDVWLELRGRRGELWINRLSYSDFTFRTALVSGASLSDAATSALEIESAFAPGLTLRKLISDRLVVAIHRQEGEA